MLATGQSVPATASLLDALSSLSLEAVRIGDMVALASVLELLDREEILRRMETRAALEVFWSLESTNTYLMNLENTELRICLAETQTAGRGRRGKPWTSPFGSNIYLSIGLPFPCPPSGLEGLSLVAGMALVDALHQYGLVRAGLKWPNDVLIDEGKLAGILVELRSLEKAGTYAVVGIGVNTGLDAAAAESIGQPWRSVDQYLTVSRNVLAADIINAVLSGLKDFEARGFAPYAGRWRSLDLYDGLPVTLRLGESLVTGRELGVDERGNLMLETEAGIEVFNAGEVSLRPC